MKKNYEVLIKAYSTVLVMSAESEEEAMEIAMNEVSGIDYVMDEAEVKREIVTPEDLESLKRHADRVCKP